MPITQPVTDSTFNKLVLDADQPVLVDFWAPWCGPCRAVAPVMDKLAREHADVLVVKINVDENPQTAASYQVMSLPHIMLFRGGEPVREVRGSAPRAVLERMLDN